MPGSTLTSHAGPGTAVHYTGSLAPGLLPLNAREFLIPLDFFFFFLMGMLILGEAGKVWGQAVYGTSVSSLPTLL